MNLQRLRPRGDDGFTMLELLSVIVIIGVLAAIALPTFLGQRQKAMSAAARSVLRDLATEEEGYLAESGAYGDVGDLVDFFPSKDVTVSIVSGIGSPTAFCASAEHSAGGGTWYFDSDAGGLLDAGEVCS